MTTAEVIRHTGAVATLREPLLGEARATPGKWARRHVLNGTGVALRLSVSKRQWQLVISRDVAPTTFMGKSRWEAEVVEIQRALGAHSWARGSDTFAGDAVAATFACPLAGGPLP